MEQPAVYVLTCAYNAERTIQRTIESVLGQTYQNILYVIRDNGSTDGTYRICEEYAKQDPRIKLVRNRKNFVYESEEDWAALRADRGIRYGEALGEQDYACILDADDEYLPDFFERAVRYGQETGAGIIVGGTEQIQEGTGLQLSRHIHGKTFLLEGTRFSDDFPEYHWHARQVWGKLYRRYTLLGYLEYYRAFLKETLGSSDEKIPYGGDTIYALYAFQRAERVGILSGCSHRYYIQEKSVSHSFPPNRVISDTILHNATTDYLIAKCGQISSRNRSFLQMVYANAIADTTHVIRISTLPPEEKLREYRAIASNPITLAVYRECTDERARRSKALLLQAALEAGAALRGRDGEDLRALAQLLLPRCGQAVTVGNLALFLETPELLKALFRDDPDVIMRDLLDRVKRGQGVKKYALTETIQALAVDRPLLCQIGDTVFLKKYGELYWEVWQEKYLSALDEMTGLLMNGQVRSGQETFLKLYLALAASLEQAAAFVFGKLRLAELYWRQKRPAECRNLVAELEEMGLGGEDEVQALRSKLGNDGPRT